MIKEIAITYPETLAFSMKMQEREFEREMKIISLVKLYELRKVSSGVAANILNISRVEFLSILARYDVSYFSSSIDDFNDDLSNA
jgi:predicted HTH domain antitoxin